MARRSYEIGLMKLVILGLGYSASAFLGGVQDRFERITVTVRDPARALAMNTLTMNTLAMNTLAMNTLAMNDGKVDGIAFDGSVMPPALSAAIIQADAMLVSIPPRAEPNQAGDPALGILLPAIEKANTLKWIGYLSTVGVYGDHGGAWVDESTPCNPVSARSIARLEAEQGWLELARADRAVQIFRLSGIYGPGQNALENLRTGTARRLIKPGQVFNRIHVSDIAGAAAHCMELALSGGSVPAIVNVTDNEPAPPQDVVAHAATLMGLSPPPEQPFETASLSPMARSFYGENKRVSNRLLTQKLGYGLRYPTYREALADLWHEMQNGG
jgi:nucleoside-diphosphate-sugar epimerase